MKYRLRTPGPNFYGDQRIHAVIGARSLCGEVASGWRNIREGSVSCQRCRNAMKSQRFATQDDELRILRSLGIAIVEAITSRVSLQLTPQISDVLIEWLEHPNAQRDATILELVNSLNGDGVAA